MLEAERKYYIDNLRTISILLLIPFHAAMAWNCWGEDNYIVFGVNTGLSAFMSLLSPFYMPLLFVLAGVSARISQKKRTNAVFFLERVRKLFVPLVIGTLTLVALMAYYADVFHTGYTGDIFSHYGVFFSRVTDFTGYDGGFTPGHLWFLLYLFIISILALLLTALQQRLLPRFSCASIPGWGIVLLGLLPLATTDVLSIGGKSVIMFLTLYLAGYYVISEDAVMEKIVRLRVPMLAIAVVCDICCTYLFVFCDNALPAASWLFMQVARWLGILAILGFARHGLNSRRRVWRYLASRSFSIYIVHFAWLVILQFYVEAATKNDILRFIIPVIGTLLLTLVTCEGFARIKTSLKCAEHTKKLNIFKEL